MITVLNKGSAFLIVTKTMNNYVYNCSHSPVLVFSLMENVPCPDDQDAAVAKWFS